MRDWLALVPEGDVQAADSLFKAVRAADADRNGKLDDRELAELPAKDAATWRARVALVGD